MKNFKFLLLFSLLLVLSFHLYSQEMEVKKDSAFSSGWAIGVKLTSLGPGVEIVKSFNELINLRLGGTYYKMNYEFILEDNISTINQAYATFGGINLMVDVNFLSFMHFSGGFIYNITSVEMNATPKDEYFIGEIEITPETVGSIQYGLTPNKICPYAGLGFGRSISRSQIVSFSFDFGVTYQGAPKVEMEANGMVSPTASEEQRQILEDNVKGYQFYPMMSFQLAFKFL